MLLSQTKITNQLLWQYKKSQLTSAASLEVSQKLSNKECNYKLCKSMTSLFQDNLEAISQVSHKPMRKRRDLIV